MHSEPAQLAASVAVPPAPVAPDPVAPEPTTVLIVDDNEINRRVLAGMLRKERYTLVHAANGDDALALARANPPDLILLDIMMPGRDGYEVCATLKAEPRTERVPVVFLSALSETADKIRGLELGAVDYITKPFDQGEVVARVRNQLKIQRLTTEVLRANRDLRDKQERIDEDLKAAATIQRTLVPAAPPALDALRVAWRFMPCDRVGGDLFNFAPLGAEALGVFVIDVAGHGVPAAMITVSLSQFLSPGAGHLVDVDDGIVRPAAPAEVLRRLESEYPLERFDKYITAAYVLIDHTSGHVRYSLGGHPQPVLLRRSGALEVLEAGGPLIGLGGVLPFDEGELVLAAGDRLVLYTDGLVELAAPDGTPFGEERLHGVVAATRGLPLDAACGCLVETALAFTEGAAPPDDITLLAIEFVGSSVRSGGR